MLLWHLPFLWAGTFITLMHQPTGYGQFYNLPKCDGAAGCSGRVYEPLAREAFAINFTMSAELAFPLRLHVRQLDVSRADAGYPSVFLALYSSTGGRSLDTLTNKMHSLVWLPIVGFLWFTYKLLSACTAHDPMISKVSALRAEP